MQKPFGLHNIGTKLYSIPLNLLYSLYKTILDTLISEPASALYRPVAIIMDNSFHSIFKPVCVKGHDKEK